MSKDKIQNTNQFKFTLLGILIGLMFPIVAWIIELKKFFLPINFTSLIYIHANNPIVYLVDMAPFVLGTIFYILIFNATKIRNQLNNNIYNMNQVLQRNSEFAKKIGRGELVSDIEIDPNDTLGQSLLLMRNNIEETSFREAEQKWIAKGKELVGDILRIQNKIEDLAYETTVTIVDYINAVQGAFYIYDDEQNVLINIATYAYNRRKYDNKSFKIGQGLVGAAAFEKDIIYRKEIPNTYVTLSSGILGDQKPQSLIITPLLGDDKLQGVIEIASLQNNLDERTINLMREITTIVGQTVFNLKVNEKTEKLLQESREMTYKLKKNEEELRYNAEQMILTQKELEESNVKLATQIEEVERARKRLFSLLENASEVISIYNSKGTITYESPSISHILGLEPEDLVGKNGFTIFDEETNNKHRTAFLTVTDNPDEPVSFEYFFKKSNGEEIWLETIGRNLLKNLAINGVIFNTRDITVRKIAEKAQRMSGRMQALSENSPDMIVRVNTSGIFVYANPIAEQFTSIGKKYLLNNNIDEIDLKPEIKDVFQNALNKILNNPIKFETETTFPLSDNEGERIVQFNAIPEFNETNELETILFVAHDITEQKQIQLEIEQKNKSITESINYARRIQSAILPTEDKIKSLLPKSFLFYLPRDVVSGDIPWIFASEKNTFVAAIDCTGHGVPGALLSFIGYFLINNIVSTKGDELDAGQILDLLHQNVRQTLQQDSPDAEARDGMDIALCKINFKKSVLDFAGAHRPLYYLKQSEQEVIQYKGTLKAIGGIPMKNRPEKNFQNHHISFEATDKIFFFSDGLADQVGGENITKYKNNSIRELILLNKQATINEFHKLIENDFYKWKGENKQIDDILLIGVEF